MGTISYRRVVKATEPHHPIDRAIHGNSANMFVRQVQSDVQRFIEMASAEGMHSALSTGRALYEGGEIGAQKLLYSFVSEAAIELMHPFGIHQIDKHWYVEGANLDPYASGQRPQVRTGIERFNLDELIGLQNMLVMQPEDAFIMALMGDQQKFYDAALRSWLDFSVEGKTAHQSPLVQRITARVKTTGDYGDALTDAILRINGDSQTNVLYDRKSVTLTARDREAAESLDGVLADFSDEFLFVTNFREGSLVEPDLNGYRGLKLMMARSDQYRKGEEQRQSNTPPRYHLIEVKVETPEARHLNAEKKGREAHNKQKWEKRMAKGDKWFELRRAVEKSLSGAEYQPPADVGV